MIERVQAWDFCCFPEVDQVLSRQGLVYIKGDHRDTAAASSNGAGKTTLFKAVTWCLYGETVDEMKGDEVIRKDTKEAKVTVTLGDGDTAWYVTRTRRKGKPGLKVEWETADEPEAVHEVKGDKKQLQAKIIELVGLDFRAFKNTVLYGQNDSFKFADPRTGDTARKDMLHRILRTETLQACHQVAKDRYKDQKAELADVMAELESIDRQVETLDLPSIEARRDRWEAGRAERVDREVEQARRYKQKAKDVLRDAPDIEAMESRLSELRTQYAAKRAASEGAEKHAARRDEVVKQISVHNRAADKAASAAGQVRKALERLKGDRCGVCSAPLTEGSPLEYKERLQEQLKEHEAARDREDEAAQKLQAEEAKANEALRACNKAAAAMREIRDEADDIKDQIADAKGVQAEADRYIEKARDAVKEAKRLKAEENPHEEALRVARSKVKKLMGKAQHHEDRRNELAEAMAYTQFWVRGYSPQGLPSFVLDAVMPFLTDRANEYLDVLADGDITMSISTQREMKSQKDAVKDEINIEWEIEGNDGVAKSGGQRTRMNLAMDLALMDLAASREGIQLDLLMIDEALDGMDKEGTARVLVLLQKLRKRRGSIFVISHSDDMSEMFEHGLVVVREGGESRVEAIR